MSNKNHNSHVSALPPGTRNLADLPPKARIAPPSVGAKPPNAKLTLRQMITEDGVKDYLIPFLRTLGTTRKKGPWSEYLAFYTANLSGDVESMKPEVKAKCEKLVKELNDEYFESQEL
jgi:hypothetical protein